MSGTQIHTSIDFGAAHGKQCGHLAIPYSHNLGGWANLQIPISVIRNGAGPVVLLMAGNHGDEYPGQVAILKLWRELKPEDVSGTLILLPCLNPPAAKASTRLSPLDGRNFNRCFPGNPNGSVSEMLAHYLTTVLFPMSEYVIDLHTGGRSMGFLPCAHMHLVPDLRQRERMLLAAEAFLTEVTFLYADVAGTGLLPTEAERQGKIVITTEMGGAEMVPAGIHRHVPDRAAQRAGALRGAARQGKVAGRSGHEAGSMGAVARSRRLSLRSRIRALRELRGPGGSGEGGRRARPSAFARATRARAGASGGSCRWLAGGKPRAFHRRPGRLRRLRGSRR